MNFVYLLIQVKNKSYNFLLMVKRMKFVVIK